MIGDGLLQVENLTVDFPIRGRHRQVFHALKDVSLDVRAGETVGLVGESGSGKTTTGRAVLGLVPVNSGTIRFQGTNITRATRRERRALSKDLQVVFQDPYSSLNPAMSIAEILTEPLRANGTSNLDANSRVGELLNRVHLPRDAGGRRAWEFSGGQRQRIAIARALAIRPKLIVCDEPVSALDLSTQAQVLNLFIELQEQSDVAYLFISHDLDVIRYVSHRVAVMKGGQIVESGAASEVTRTPVNPYTQRLLLSSPVIDPDEQKRRRQAQAKIAG
jgi:ABC-type glutathione transport system ATPase component